MAESPHYQNSVLKCSSDTLKDFDTMSVVRFGELIGVNIPSNLKREEIVKLILERILAINKVQRFQYRETIFNTVRKILKNVELVNGYACTSHKNPRQLMDVMTLQKFLGYGAKGSVFSSYMNFSVGYSGLHMPFFPMAVKFTKLHPDTFNILRGVPTRRGRWTWHKLYIDTDIRELIASSMVNKILELNATPSLIYTYWWYLCDKCQETHKIKAQRRIPVVAPCTVMIMEKICGDLRTIVDTLSAEEWIVMIFEVLWALNCLQTYWGLAHNDTEVRNVFYSAETPGGYLEFIDENENSYYVPKYLHTFYVGDYGMVSSDRYFGANSGQNIGRGGSGLRDTKTGATNMPSTYDNFNMRTLNEESLVQLITSMRRIPPPPRVEKDVITPLVQAMGGAVSKSVIAPINYPELIRKVFKPIFGQKPGGLKTNDILATYTMKRPQENFDQVYFNITSTMI